MIDFITTKKGEVRPVVVGGRAFTSEILAQRYIDEANLSQRAEIMPLPTSSQSTASGMIKAKLAARYHDLEKGMTRAVHKVPNSEGVS